MNKIISLGIIGMLSVLSFAVATALYLPLIEITQEQYEEPQKMSDVPNILDLVNQIINDKYATEYWMNYVPPKKVWRAGGSGNPSPILPKVESIGNNWCDGADVDHNGEVNSVDYFFWKTNYGETGCSEPDWCDGTDVNQDGVVDSEYYGVWQANYGRTDCNE